MTAFPTWVRCHGRRAIWICQALERPQNGQRQRDEEREEQNAVEVEDLSAETHRDVHNVLRPSADP